MHLLRSANTSVVSCRVSLGWAGTTYISLQGCQMMTSSVVGCAYTCECCAYLDTLCGVGMRASCQVVIQIDMATAIAG